MLGGRSCPLTCIFGRKSNEWTFLEGAETGIPFESANVYMSAMWESIRSLVSTISDSVRRRNHLCRGLSSPWDEETPTNRISLVGLVVRDHDRRMLTAIGGRYHWNMSLVDSCEEARAALDRLKAPIVLFDRDLPGWEWRAVMQILASSPNRVCVILISKVIDDYLRNEVICTGGYDVLPTPLRENDVFRVVKLAWSYWVSVR